MKLVDRLTYDGMQLRTLTLNNTFKGNEPALFFDAVENFVEQHLGVEDYAKTRIA